MAFLRRAAMLVGLTMVLSCHGGGEVGELEVERFDSVVDCPEADGPCIDSSGEPQMGEESRSWAFLSSRVADADRGVLLYGEVEFETGRGYLEVEADPYARSEMSRADYVEVEDGEVTFRAEEVAGRIEMPAERLEEDCVCTDVRLELVFRSAGEDGIIGTDDDAVRRLSRGHASQGGWCVEAERLPVEETFELSFVERCVSRASPPPPERLTTSPFCETCTDEVDTSDSASCQSDGGGCESDGGGCESDGGGCESDSGGGGCEGDSGGGCEGDSGGGCEGDSGGGCEPDAAAGPPTCGSPRGPIGRVMASGRTQLVFLIFLVLADIQRRGRLDWT